MKFHVLTLFPEMIMQGVEHSILGRAIKEEKIFVQAVNIRDYADNKHHKVDDYPYGGGAGMLMQAEPVYRAYESIAGTMDSTKKRRVIYVTPQGTPFNQKLAEDFSRMDELIFLCGHYEGIDERVLEEVVTDYVSIGDYVLTGGELASLVMIDAVSRLVPGVLNNDISSDTESFHSDLLEHPQYSRPAEWRGKKVPQVLLSGNQKKIRQWQKEQSIERTRSRRPDLYERYLHLEHWKERMMKDKLNHIDMIETIERGDAILVAETEHELLIQEKCSKSYLHTCLSEHVTIDTLSHAKDEVALHQEAAKKLLEETGRWFCTMDCYLMTYTQRQKCSMPKCDLPFEIRPLEMEHFDYVAANYDLLDADYVKDLIGMGNHMWGAFIGQELVAFIGKHKKGEMGLLFVEPAYRQHKIGKALEIFLINYEIENGNIPYGEVVDGNEKSMRLQESIGMYSSKNLVHWMEEK